MASQRVWIARHANRKDFADPDWATSADRPHDPGLSPDGLKQAQQLGRRVVSLDVDRIFASPFLRAVQTAHQVASIAEDAVFLEPGLGEWQNPDWFDGLAAPLDATTLADRFERVDLGHEPCRQPEYPESKHAALSRLGATARCLVEHHSEETLLLVGHGITVLGVLHGLVDGPVPDPGCPLASLTLVERQGTEWQIALRNDTQHLENGARAADRLA